MAVVLDTDQQSEIIAPEVPNYLIRPACPTDLDKIGKLWAYHRQYHRQWDDLYTTTSSGQDKWLRQIASCLTQFNHGILVAVDPQDQVVGYIHGSFYPWPNSPIKFYGSLNTITVAEHAQGQGLGRKLIDSLLEWFQAYQIEHISLHVDYRNDRALRLYRHTGFRPYQLRLMLDLSKLDSN